MYTQQRAVRCVWKKCSRLFPTTHTQIYVSFGTFIKRFIKQFINVRTFLYKVGREIAAPPGF